MKLLWLPLFAAGLRAAALPGWWAGWLVLMALVPRLVWWERAGSARRRFLGDWLAGTLFWILAFSFLANTFWAMPFDSASTRRSPQSASPRRVSQASRRSGSPTAAVRRRRTCISAVRQWQSKKCGG